MEKIKRCPICGGYAKIRAGAGWYVVRCDGCGTETRKFYKNGGVTPAMVQNAAIAQWNQRLSDEGERKEQK